jgi:hypothetical protein
VVEEVSLALGISSALLSPFSVLIEFIILPVKSVNSITKALFFPSLSGILLFHIFLNSLNCSSVIRFLSFC